MSGRTGLSVGNIYYGLQNAIKHWSLKKNDLLNSLGGNDVPIDNINRDIYHDARRTLENIQTWSDRVISMGWAQSVRDFGAIDQGENYDAIAEGIALRDGLIALQAACVTAVGGVDGNGFITGNYAKMSNTPPYYDVVTAANYAVIITALNNLSFDNT